jgi:predicted esterase
MKPALALLLLAVQAPALKPAAPAASDLPRGKVVEKVVCAANPQESYALYLPSGYTPDRAWPILYVLDPRSQGTAAAERFRQGAEKYGYILASSNNTLSDTSIDPNVQALRAMWADTHGRLAIDDHRVFGAGFSGTVRSCCTLARAVPGTFVGIIGAGAGFPFHEPPKKGDPFVFFGTVGDKDFNYYEMMDLEPRLREAGITHSVEIFDGVHQWPPEELATRALGWMEIQAMKAGLRPRDPGVIEELWGQTIAHARAAEIAGDLFQAHRYYASAAAGFAGLRDTSEASTKAAALAANPALQREWKEREARLQRDKDLLAKAPGILAAALEPGGEPTTVYRVAGALKIPELRARAKSAPEADERLSAQRVLNTIGIQTAYYLPQSFLEKKQWDRAIFVLSIATEISPEKAFVWYNRAEAYARKGDRKRALADLQQAADKGWTDLTALQQNDAFAPFRQDPEYQRLTAALEPRKPNP